MPATPPPIASIAGVPTVIAGLLALDLPSDKLRIEGVLLGHPAAMVAAAVGEPDAYAGELPVACVSLVPGQQATPEELAAFVAPRIAARRSCACRSWPAHAARAPGRARGFP